MKKNDKLKMEVALLEKRNESLNIQVSYLEDFVRSLKKELWGEDYYRHEDNEIIKEFARLKEKVRKEGEIVSHRLDSLDSENSKLWYLIRAMVNDTTLKGEPEGEISNHTELTRMVNTPFRKPRF